MVICIARGNLMIFVGVMAGIQLLTAFFIISSLTEDSTSSFASIGTERYISKHACTTILDKLDAQFDSRREARRRLACARSDNRGERFSDDTHQYDVFEAEANCLSGERLGARDGPKFVCGIDMIKEAQDDCLVFYSLGSNEDVHYYEGTVKKELGCEMHTFDPTTSTVSVLKRIGQKGRRIDMLEIDTQEGEFGALTTLLGQIASGEVVVDQIQVKLSGAKFSAIRRLFEHADAAKMRIMHKERNHWGCNEGHECWEYSFVSETFLRRHHEWLLCDSNKGMYNDVPSVITASANVTSTGIAGKGSASKRPLIRYFPESKEEHGEYDDTMILPADSPRIQKEMVLSTLPEGQVVIDARKLRAIEQYHSQYNQEAVPSYVQVYENYLDEPAQEVGVCSVGSKLYYFGGYNETLWANFTEREPFVVALGTNKTWVYDMEDMSITPGPTMPNIANHISCAATSDGILHLTGGYRQDAPVGEEYAYFRHWVLDTNISLDKAKWETRADMPLARGAHGCRFLNDGKMYCVGGSSHQWGPFARDLMIYDPESDEWRIGPPMHDPRDHVMTIVSLFDDNALFVVGGRSHVIEDYPEGKRHPYFWTTSYSAEIFDIRTNKWKLVRAPSTPREATSLVSWKRHDSNRVLLVGGQRFYGYSGHVINTLDEFDPVTGLYHCHEPLPFPVFGPAIGIHHNKLHIVGGGEWMGISAQRRVMVVDLNKAPLPRNCFYKETPIFDQWNRTYNDDTPFPGADASTYYSRHPAQSYAYHEHMFKDVLLGHYWDTKKRVNLSDLYWDELPVEAKAAAELLGYTKDSWNNDESVTIFQTDFDSLDENRKSAAKLLGLESYFEGFA